MLKDCVAILSIGSSNVNLIVGERGVNGTFIIRASASVDYYAFMNGEFSDIKELESVILKLLTTINKSSEISEINKIFVGVPGEYSKTVTKNFKITFNTTKKINVKTVKALYDIAYEDVDCEYTLAHRSAVYFSVDNSKVNNPIGMKGSSLAGRLSYVLVSNNFKEVITHILKKGKVNKIHFISEDYAESQYLFKGDEKSACKIVVDVGSVTTSFAISVGNGLLYSGAIPLGGGMITAYLYDKFKCDYHIAELLKRKINLGLRENPLAEYVITDNAGVDYTFLRDEVNDIARSVLDNLAEEFEKVFSKCPLKIPSDSDTYFTGGGICYIRGAVEYISSRIGAIPRLIKPSLPRYDKPECSARLSLLDTALNKCGDKIFFA